MRKQIYSLIIILFAAMCLFVYSMLWSSSLRLENNKSLFNAQYYKKNGDSSSIHLKQPVFNKPWLYNRFFQDPAEIELYLRAELFSNNFDNPEKLTQLYQFLLSTKPSWPYYYSGLAQVDLSDDAFSQKNVDKAMQYGVYERKVVKSIAEILFHDWDKVDELSKIKVLNYLSNQKAWTIAEVVNISARFSRVYEYCDFLYEKKRVEYAPCKQQYWQPLAE